MRPGSPHWGTTRVHLGLLFGLVAAVILWIVLRRTRWGYEIGVMGENPRAALYAGMPTKRTILLVMALSGALAGLAGMSEVAGIGHQLQRNLSPGYGYAAIIVAWLGRLHPFGAVLVAFLLAALTVGGDQIQMSLGLPAAIAPMLQGTILFFLLGGDVLTRYRITRVTGDRVIGCGVSIGLSAQRAMQRRPDMRRHSSRHQLAPISPSRRHRSPLAMSDILTPAFIVSVLAAAVAAGTAILFACLGELITERAGVLNLGIEGIMLMGALVGVGACIWSGSAWVGAAAALVAGAAMAAIHALLCVGLRANQVVSGLALTIFGAGLSAFLGRDIVGVPPPSTFRRVDIPVLAEIPALGRILFQQSALVYISLALVVILWWYIYRTRAGLRLRAIGERPEAADAMGVDVARLRALYVIAGGALAGLGGAAISLGTNPGWTEGMTAGRGWIAVALVIFAAWNPARAAVGAYLFGGVEAGPVPAADRGRRRLAVLPEHAAVPLHDPGAGALDARGDPARARRTGCVGPGLHPRGPRMMNVS